MITLEAIPKQRRKVIRVNWEQITKAQYWAIYCALESDWKDETETKMDNGIPYEIVTSRLSGSSFPFLKMVDNRLYFRAEIYSEEEN